MDKDEKFQLEMSVMIRRLQQEVDRGIKIQIENEYLHQELAALKGDGEEK